MHLLLCSWLLLLGGGLLALMLNPWPRLSLLLGSGTAVAASLVGLVAAVGGLMANSAITVSLPLTLPGASFSLLVDGLSAFFLLPIFLIGLAGALYGQEYMAAGGRWPGVHWLFYNLLILSMAVVVTAANGMLFLFAWEVMSLTSFFLVIGEHRDAAVGRAGLIYLLATHLGAALLFLFFLMAGAQAATLDFAAFGALKTIPAPMASLLFVLIMVGFGSKAGLFPFHVWLPEAHPAAPSHVSALMSGVMVKTAIYGLIRMLSFLPPPPAWWGGVLLSLGLIGALFGIAMAAGQQDVKRGLAYSTVENVGLIFVALGFWLLGRANGQALAAALALCGGLLHIWNHALFKSLLFLGAGSLVHGSGTRNLNRMGGLLRRMPFTGLLLVAGSMAVMALPPFNGLVGEWFIYRALLETGVRLSGLAAFLPLIVLGLLALVGGMVLMVFTRLVGIALCGEPRQPEAAAAHEAGWRMLAPMAVLALLCLAGGLMPAILIRPVSRVAALIDPQALVVLQQAGVLPVWLGWLGWGVVVLVAMAVLCRRWLQVKRAAASAPTWGCGYAFATRRMAYSAEGFSQLAATSFFSKGLQPLVAEGRSLALFPETTLFRHQAPDLVLEGLFAPLFDRVGATCLRCRRLQSGLVHIYVGYIFLTTVLLLAWAWVAWR